MEGSGAGNGLACSKEPELYGGEVKASEKLIPSCCRKALAAMPEAEAKLHATVVSGWFCCSRCCSGKY